MEQKPRHEEFNIKALDCSFTPIFLILVQVIGSLLGPWEFSVWIGYQVLRDGDPDLFLPILNSSYIPLTKALLPATRLLGADCKLRSLNSVFLNLLWFCSVYLLGNPLTNCYHYVNSLSMPHNIYFLGGHLCSV